MDALQHKCSFAFPRKMRHIAPEQPLSVDYLGWFDICILSVPEHENVMDAAGRSNALGDHSRRAQDAAATREERAPGGVLKTLTELCVEADENTLKVNGPLGLCSPSYWLPVAATTLLLQSEYHSRS